MNFWLIVEDIIYDSFGTTNNIVVGVNHKQNCIDSTKEEIMKNRVEGKIYKEMKKQTRKQWRIHRKVKIYIPNENY